MNIAQSSSPAQLASVLTAAADWCIVQGDSAEVLTEVPTASVDICVTSPPYWSQRNYNNSSGLGNEASVQDYVSNLVQILRQVKRVLTPGGSLWLNLGDTYIKKQLVGVPWRVALALQDDGWILRNDVIWDKEKGAPDNARDKLRNIYEHIFHLVKQPSYYYDVDAIRSAPGKPYFKNGRIVTATGVSGIKYERQIARSTHLTDGEKQAALGALNDALERVKTGELPDFRMIIRGTQRFTHSDSADHSGRAQELKKKGYAILPYHKNGAKPTDIWRILPEDQWRKDKHYAVFPIELCELPIRSSCPPDGIVLDPFAGTGTALLAALQLGRRAIGIDSSAEFVEYAHERITTFCTRQRQQASSDQAQMVKFSIE